MRIHKRADRSGPQPAPGEPWPLAGVDVLDDIPVWKPSSAWVSQAALEGWVSLDKGKLVIHSRPKVVYSLVRGPGRYCCHCWAPLDSEDHAREHVEAEHAGVESPDPSNPSGWCVNDFYTCEKEG